MSKFHVGDRWADQDGHEWLVFGERNNMALAFCQKLSASHQIHDDGWSIHTVRPVKLTRLIASERWIPFAEMTPDSANDRPGQMLVVEYATDTHSLFISSEGDEGWFEWCERWGDNGYERLTPSDMRNIGGTHWRYLTPPEVS